MIDAPPEKKDSRKTITLRLTMGQIQHIDQMAKDRSIGRQNVLDFAVNLMCYIQGADEDDRAKNLPSNHTPRLVYKHRDESREDLDLGIWNMLPDAKRNR